MSQENKIAETFPWDYKFGDENFQKEPWILNKGKQNVTIKKNLDNKGFFYVQKNEERRLKIILNGKLLNGLFTIDGNFCQLTKNN